VRSSVGETDRETDDENSIRASKSKREEAGEKLARNFQMREEKPFGGRSMSSTGECSTPGRAHRVKNEQILL
jgi:hypothetical protein